MGVQVKICGITTMEGADAAVRAAADFAGLVFHPASPRRLQPDQARTLAARLKGRLRIVALLADPDDEALGTACAAAAPDFIQLHGREEPERVAAIRSKFAVPVIKALAIAEARDFANVPAYEEVADMILFDARAPEAANRPGGHGAAFDWQLLRGRSFSRPWILAGGLSPENVARAIRTSGAMAVDVSSGVESETGRKDPERIRAFIAAARSAQFASRTEA